MDILLHIIGYWLIGLIVCGTIDIVGKSEFRPIEFFLALFWPLILLVTGFALFMAVWLAFCNCIEKAWKEFM